MIKRLVMFVTIMCDFHRSEKPTGWYVNVPFLKQIMTGDEK